MPDLFDEIKDELRQDRLASLFKKHGTKLLAALGIVIVLTGAGSWYRAHLQASREESGDQYQAALLALQNNDKAVSEKLDALIEDGARGYRELAVLKKAEGLAEEKKFDEAVQLYDKLTADSGADRVLRDLASLRAAGLLLAHKPDDTSLGGRLGELSRDGSVWKYTAREWQGARALARGGKEDAKTIFAALAGDGGAPPSVRERARQLAEMAGK